MKRILQKLVVAAALATVAVLGTPVSAQDTGPKMPDVIDKTCEDAMDDINALADPDPTYEHYDVVGNPLVFVPITHHPWLVKRHEPPAGDNIGNLVKLYIEDPRTDPPADDDYTWIIVITVIVIGGVVIVIITRRRRGSP